MSVVVEIVIESPQWATAPGAERTIRRAIEAAVADAGPAETEIGVVLADDERIRELNRVWLGNDKATNVLSFPAPARPGGGPAFLGDIALAMETIRHESETEEKPFEHHLAHLAVHGVLHLLGFDHERDADAEIMESRERRILADLGIPDPYTRERRTEPA